MFSGSVFKSLNIYMMLLSLPSTCHRTLPLCHHPGNWKEKLDCDSHHVGWGNDYYSNTGNSLYDYITGRNKKINNKN